MLAHFIHLHQIKSKYWILLKDRETHNLGDTQSSQLLESWLINELLWLRFLEQFYTESVSYQMTPADPLILCDNYDIKNLSSEDSTDDEDCPKKV